ncbi:transposase [Streptomyces caelestis]|uniref:transposase n=1 Tax=Streptomyces TaxID=1883 RepID=UPI001428C650
MKLPLDRGPLEAGILRFRRKQQQVGSTYPKRYTEEFKRDAIALVDSSGETVTVVARELGVSSESLRGWYRRAKADRPGRGRVRWTERRRARGARAAAQGGPRTAADDRDPEKATAFLAKENDR